MNKQEARQYLDDIVESKRRWGKLSVAFDTAGKEKLLEALELLIGDDSPTVPKEDYVLVQRQLTAAKAREAKLKKQIEQLQAASGEDGD